MVTAWYICLMRKESHKSSSSAMIPSIDDRSMHKQGNIRSTNFGLLYDIINLGMNATWGREGITYSGQNTVFRYVMPIN